MYSKLLLGLLFTGDSWIPASLIGSIFFACFLAPCHEADLGKTTASSCHSIRWCGGHQEGSVAENGKPAGLILFSGRQRSTEAATEIPVVLGAPLREQRDGHFDIERIRSGRVFCRLAALLHVPPPTG